uniref:Complex 1 LYR protein domain-containing protein n=1 Tax=Kalanchoe fedtschenkoi TaxID=63787 RepID=A0A7N0ULM1_KALFE
MASRSEILSLFRSLYRTARQFPDYNVREYIKRRTADGFRLNRDAPDAAAVFADGKAQLEVAKRQAVVYSLYAPKVRSIMELKP